MKQQKNGRAHSKKVNPIKRQQHVGTAIGSPFVSFFFAEKSSFTWLINYR